MNETTNVERLLANTGRAMMDAAVAEKDDAYSNKLARVGSALTELGSVHANAEARLTLSDWEMVEEFIAENQLTD